MQHLEAHLLRLFGVELSSEHVVTPHHRRKRRPVVASGPGQIGIRRIDVGISADTTLKAFYQRRGRVIPELPSEGSGDME